MSDTLHIDIQAFVELIAETFDISPSLIGLNTLSADVPGWDSLGHSVLLSRLDKRFHFGLIEADAAPAETVRELYDRISRLAKVAA